MSAAPIAKGPVDVNVRGVDEHAYLTEVVTQTIFKYNPKYGDERVCKCGHTYCRHFDSHEDMEPIGCKYCECMEFVEAHNAKVSGVGLPPSA
jgi:hypothetical protein